MNSFSASTATPGTTMFPDPNAKTIKLSSSAWLSTHMAGVECLVADMCGRQRAAIFLYGKKARFDGSQHIYKQCLTRHLAEAVEAEDAAAKAGKPKPKCKNFVTVLNAVRYDLKVPALVNARDRKLRSEAQKRARKSTRRNAAGAFSQIDWPQRLQRQSARGQASVDCFPSTQRIPIVSDSSNDCNTAGECFASMGYTMVDNHQRPPSFKSFPPHYLDYTNKNKDQGLSARLGSAPACHDHCGADCRISADSDAPGTLGRMNGVPCRSVNCVYMQWANKMPKNKRANWRHTLYHFECLQRFRGGDIRICGWCVLYLFMVSFAFSPTERFATTFDPNLKYEPWQHFKLRVNGTASNANAAAKFEQFCVLKATLAEQTLYYVVRYRSNSDLIGNARTLFSQTFGTTTLDAIPWEVRAKLADHSYTYAYYCPIDKERKESEIQFKTEPFSGFCTNIVLLKSLWPRLLREKCGELSLQKLFELKQAEIIKWMEDPDNVGAASALWAATSKSAFFKILFAGFSYKENTLRKKTDAQMITDPDGEYAVYEVPRDIFRECGELDDLIREWYDCVLNPLLQQLASDIPELAHWKDIKLVWQGMKELLLYCINPGRHIDTKTLFHPDVNNPSAGAFTLAHNFVKAELSRCSTAASPQSPSTSLSTSSSDAPSTSLSSTSPSESLSTSPSSSPSTSPSDSPPKILSQKGDKTFCICSHPKMNGKKCGEVGATLNHHYNHLAAGDMLVVVKDAAYFCPHKVEQCGKAENGGIHVYTSLTMSRNYGDKHRASKSTFTMRMRAKFKKLVNAARIKISGQGSNKKARHS